MSAPGRTHAQLAGTAAMVTIGLLLVACGNDTKPSGDATQLLRWYDYPLPSDPGSEDGGFPYAVTLKGSTVSVLAFREMGPGVQPVNFERITRAAAAHLT